MRNIYIVTVIAILESLAGCFYYGPCIDGSGALVQEERDLSGFSSITNTGSFEVNVTQSDRFVVEVVAQQNLLPIIETYVSGSTLIIKSEDGRCFRSSTPVIVNVELPLIEEIMLSGSGKIDLGEVSNEAFECSNSGSGRIDIDVVAADLTDLGNSGSGTIFINEIFSYDLTFVQSGSGTIESGVVYDASEVSIFHSSSGQIKSSLVNGSHIQANLSGSGRIILDGEMAEANFILNSSGRIDALDLMTADVTARNTGSGNIKVYATDFLEVSISGSGDVIYRGDPEISYRITGSGDIKQY